MALDLRPTPVTQSTIDAIAVLPLRNLTGDAEQQYLTDGMTEAVMSSLAQVRSIEITGSRLGHEVPKHHRIATRDHADAGRGRDRRRVAATFRRTHSARVQVIGADGSVWMPAGISTQPIGSADAAGDRCPDHRRRDSRASQSVERQRLLNPKPVQPDAYTQYSLGRHNHWKQDEASFRRAIGYFERAIACSLTMRSPTRRWS